jgi:hypothetical protein
LYVLIKNTPDSIRNNGIIDPIVIRYIRAKMELSEILPRIIRSGSPITKLTRRDNSPAAIICMDAVVIGEVLASLYFM